MSCEEDVIETPPIDGIWVETIYKSDTLVFESESELFNLNRGGENLSLNARSQPFFYNLEKDSISISWVFSSATFGRKYYFQMDSKQIRIGNFFVDSLNNQNEILTFLKIN